MTYLEKITKENTEKEKLNEWAANRKEIIHQTTDFYNTKGLSFARDLKKLLKRYQDRPTLNGQQVINQIINQ